MPQLVEPTGRSRWRWLPWALGLVAVVAALGWAILFLPGRLYPPLPDSAVANLGPEQRIELQTNRQRLQNDTRTALLQGIGGTVLLIGAVVTWRQLQISRRQLQHNIEATRAQLEATHEQLALSRLGQVTERFTRAVEQLGNDASVDIQLGGIYALEQIGRDSPDDRVAIAEILAAFVRGHSPWPPPSSGPFPPTSAVRFLPPLRLRAPAVQAGLTVLGRLTLPEAASSLDLADTDLRRLELGHAELCGASLARSHLEGARLRHAHLDGTDLGGAALDQADLEHADLAEADLRAATLHGARLDGAVLTGARLEDASFEGARLHGSDLRHAIGLQQASLQGAIADRATTWPPGFDAQVAGVVVEQPAPTSRPRATGS
jgi:Pentapeptide repeats (8 copies)